jgi:hypothetical protein
MSFVDYRFNNAPDFKTEYLYNTVGPKLFVYNWPAVIPIVDDRDPMHKRGWTYFSISGTTGEQEIAGHGCMPFVYNMAKEHPAWLSLKIGQDLEIIDCGRGAYLRQGGRTIASYEPGTFFKGLARPWMGLHTANIVRRDAAEQRIWFHSEWTPNEKDVIVDISDEEQQNKTDLIYTIDMEDDIIKTMTFDVNGQARGSLIFSYMQEIDRPINQLTEPDIPAGAQPPAQSPGIRWLIRLAQGNLGK